MEYVTEFHHTHTDRCPKKCPRVIPRTLMPREITGETIGEVRAVSDMHQRKAEMAHQADAFIALPGGYGTLEELLQVITWAQLGIHHKPVGLLNVEGYYNSLLSFLDKAVDEGFISPTARRIIVSAPTDKQLVKELEVTGEGDDKYLIATAEQPLCAYHLDDWIHPSQLPNKWLRFVEFMLHELLDMLDILLASAKKQRWNLTLSTIGKNIECIGVTAQ
ncbi:hypothetical protein HYC85_018059 [Camellia sinensis]|uniref:Cytokinin riboside 5'-monophosphate phosphoribohydrolase n=1 Tax=Camellia sinensis TaxID=4442 RepID=A0A7J7GT88_CAMSI|nr:hypothetical protein HYC85_018059 [Camellia sinensis]